MDCPGYENGCRCRACYGLAEFMLDNTGHDHGLPRAQPVRLHVVTPGPELDDPCDSTMTCGCRRCVKERAGRKPREVRQPWDVRRGRSAA